MPDGLPSNPLPSDGLVIVAKRDCPTCVVVVPVLAQLAAGPSPLTGVKGGDATPALWIAIERDGTVKITCHRSEMGQQTWTAMAQIVADELEADWDKVAIVQAEGHERYGDQNTDGSRSVRFNFHRLRVAGAAMRHMLVAAAALELLEGEAGRRNRRGLADAAGQHEPSLQQPDALLELDHAQRRQRQQWQLVTAARDSDGQWQWATVMGDSNG